jgi:hypothetical protein
MTAELPEELQAYFWDYDSDRISWEKSRYTIVFRLIEKGGMDAVRWLREHMSDDELLHRSQARAWHQPETVAVLERAGRDPAESGR